MIALSRGIMARLTYAVKDGQVEVEKVSEELEENAVHLTVRTPLLRCP